MLCEVHWGSYISLIVARVFHHEVQVFLTCKLERGLDVSNSLRGY